MLNLYLVAFHQRDINASEGGHYEAGNKQNKPVRAIKSTCVVVTEAQLEKLRLHMSPFQSGVMKVNTTSNGLSYTNMKLKAGNRLIHKNNDGT